MDLMFDRDKYECKWVYTDTTQEKRLKQADNRLGWEVFGDTVSMKNAENFSLVRDLHYYKKEPTTANCDDILFSLINWKNSMSEPITQLSVNKKTVFDSKTQGYPYHLYILAIACLIESRFPQYAVVDGDVSIGQMKKAREWANSILEKPIQLTDRANNEKLLERINKVLEDEYSALEAFMALTMNSKDLAFGNFIREHFSSGVVKAYHLKLFQKYDVNMMGFQDLLETYLNQGYSLEAACDGCVLDENGCGYDPVEFMEALLSLGWDKEDNLCEDALQLAGDNLYSQEPDTIPALFGKIFLKMAGFKQTVKSTLTHEEITSVLYNKFGGLCDVDFVLNQHLPMEEAAAAELGEEGLNPNASKEQAPPDAQEYDIVHAEDLMRWEQNQTLHPKLENSLIKIKAFVESLIKQEHELLDRFHSSSEKERMRWLIKKNNNIYINKRTWDYIEEQINNHHIADRVFAVLSIKAEEQTIHRYCSALLNNLQLLRTYIL